MEYQDKVCTCVEETCETPNKEFIVTAGEQDFFAQQGWPIPKRCKDCRQKKKNRATSPFKDVADQFKQKSFKNNRRHGRERTDDWDTGNNNH